MISREHVLYFINPSIFIPKKNNKSMTSKEILQLHRLIYTVFICGKMKTESGKLITSKNHMKNVSWPSSATVFKFSSHYLLTFPPYWTVIQFWLRHIALYQPSDWSVRLLAPNSRRSAKKRCTLILDVIRPNVYVLAIARLI